MRFEAFGTADMVQHLCLNQNDGQVWCPQEKEQLRSAAAALREETNERNAALAKAEESLKVSQKRYIRLNADFDNFRKRTVRGPLTISAHLFTTLFHGMLCAVACRGAMFLPS